MLNDPERFKINQPFKNRTFLLETTPISWASNKHDDEDDHCIYCLTEEVNDEPKCRYSLYLKEKQSSQCVEYCLTVQLQ